MGIIVVQNINRMLGLYFNYVITKGQLWVAQSLSDENSFRGSSYIIKIFRWENIDWKLILKINTALFA